MEIQVASCFLKDTFPADFATGSHIVEMTKMSRCVKSVEIPGVNDTSLSCIFPKRNTIIFFMAQLKHPSTKFQSSRKSLPGVKMYSESSLLLRMNRKTLEPRRQQLL